MIKLYFGNVPNILSTILFLIFVVFFIRTMKKMDGEKKWKKAAIITVLMGTAMSALSGIKDSLSATMAVSFEEMNLPLAILCALGGIALLMGVVAVICKKDKINKGIFYALSMIIIVKTIIVEVLRIASRG
ncbi:MAG: hypothetical protein J5476_12905 [Lachnospiraceae bacterium]|nr:hypothetical protein [Lachnospiraceae bacterium]